MAQTGRTLELDQRVDWVADQQDDEARWPIHKTALFVVTSSAALWAGIFALISWIW